MRAHVLASQPRTRGKRMKTSLVIKTTAVMLLLALATALPAQTDPSKFPAEAFSPDSCQAVAWNGKILKRHPRMINACQEIVHVDNEAWARFSASLERFGPQGKVIFNVHDHRGRYVDQLKLNPEPNQVVLIDGRPLSFRQIEKRDRFNLYVPASEFGQSLTPCRGGMVTQAIE